MINKEISQALSDKIVEYLNNRRDDKEESFLKSKAKKNKQGKVTNGAIIERVIACIKKISSEKYQLSDIEKLKKSKDQTSLEFQKEKLERLLALVGENVVNQELIDLKSEYKKFVITNTKDHEPINWLNEWSSKAVDISFATHVGKLTHSSSKSSSILDVTTETNDSYLTTNQLKTLAVDTASSNAASLPVADVLKLSVNNVSVLDLIKSGDDSVFIKFTDNQSTIDGWCESFKQAFDSSKKQSYFLSKQVYFPVSENQYHLLMPLASSSLIQELHLEHKKRWEEPLHIAFDQQSKKMYSPTIVIRYPNKAYLHVTGSNHSNASSLNGKRGGRIPLMSALPPQWNSRLPSYVDKSSIFSKELAFELKEEIGELAIYLLLLKNKELSINEPKRNAAIFSKLRVINGALFNYIESINETENCEGWTASSKLPIEEQLLFESQREDEGVRVFKTDHNWQKKISGKFGRWLNQQLEKNKKLGLTPIQASLWADCFLIDLKERVAVREVEL